MSVITVVYNAGSLFRETLQSVAQQTHPDIEYVVIDGGSTDGTIELIEANLTNIDFFVSEKDKGIYDAMNKGIRASNGEWLIFLNAGDTFASADTVEKCMQALGEDTEIVYGSAALNGPTIDRVLKPKQFNLGNLIFWGTRTLCHQSIFVNRSIVAEYDDSLRLKGELDWYFKLLKKVKTKPIRKNLVVCRYLLGGVGEQRLMQNAAETLKVLFANAGIFGVLGIPVLLYKILATRFLR
ncbi:glycosyltransferase family 2 protein [Imperialibacter roseus]|uniref:Glycosyltransferase family 2 protein n=1 Tax=Imperialibacter roseus TaxID=1324217 RepID=A0ABZ0INY7_9BACT|nr:glycosyltransferase family 2 protein [Imperialibacter roseus]WOK06281.1 glycosyltransferase family 2 protein [Imperialibacter roseus]